MRIRKPSGMSEPIARLRKAEGMTDKRKRMLNGGKQQLDCAQEKCCCDKNLRAARSV